MQKAADKIKLRVIEQLSKTPADNPTPAGAKCCGPQLH
jgi:hypothetical protein